MGISIQVIPTEGLPDPEEPITNFIRCPGNILTAPQELGFDRLDKCGDPEAALLALIQELDKGDDGLFVYELWEKWSDRFDRGRQLAKDRIDAAMLLDHCTTWDATVEQVVADRRRARMRKSAFRFYCYVKMGYKLVWSD